MALSLVYATDEDIVIRAGADFVHICPPDQTIAKGVDGVFGVGNRWLLTSTSTDWIGQGVAAGMVAQLNHKGTFTGTELLPIDSVSSGGATLRRRGQASGIGFAPGPIAGVTGVSFLVASLYPQIEDASYDLNRRFGVDERLPTRSPASFYDVREARQACVLTVLRRQYLAMARLAGDKSDDLYAKAQAYSQELDDTLARLVIHWQNLTGWGLASVEPVTSRFGMRMSR